MSQQTIIQAPLLDIDAFMAKKYNTQVSPNGRLERRIVANLIHHLEGAGFKVGTVHDGDELNECADMKSAMELIFNLDEAWLNMEKPELDTEHTIFLVMGNGLEIISDWSFNKGDADGFDAAMEAFDAEQYA